jgi:hypothetical protein
VKIGFEFDVYVEGQHGLAVPTDEVVAWSVLKEGLRVASVEHLLILKLDAFASRKGSVKGAKDEDDIVRLLLSGDPQHFLASNGRAGLARMTDDRLNMLKAVVKGDAIVRLHNGNLHRASQHRVILRSALDAIETSMKENFTEWSKADAQVVNTEDDKMDHIEVNDDDTPSP